MAQQTTRHQKQRDSCACPESERQLWKNRRSVDHELVRCCWNSRMPDNCQQDNGLGFIGDTKRAPDALSPQSTNQRNHGRIGGRMMVEGGSDGLRVCVVKVLTGRQSELQTL
ncbi:hypothetical protein T06_5601 [Trichinella sp. T6]|nr:hypothetical protein T06_5601 [Trichinella sp. T6]